MGKQQHDWKRRIQNELHELGYLHLWNASHVRDNAAVESSVVVDRDLDVNHIDVGMQGTPEEAKSRGKKAKGSDKVSFESNMAWVFFAHHTFCKNSLGRNSLMLLY